MKLENALKYFNAKVIYDGKAHEVRSWTYLTNKIEIGFNKWVKVSDCKLQLRTMSSLTDEELENIKETYLNDCFDNPHIPKVNGKPQLDQSREEILTLVLEVCSLEQIAEFIDYLRSINIDIDGLIDAGEAEQI